MSPRIWGGCSISEHCSERVIRRVECGVAAQGVENVSDRAIRGRYFGTSLEHFATLS